MKQPPNAQPTQGIHHLKPAQPGSALPASQWAFWLSETARELGFARLAVVPALPMTDAHAAWARWLRDGFQAEMAYMERPRSDPAHLLPGVRSLVAGIAVYERPLWPRRGRDGYVAGYARGADYHHVLKERLLRLAQALCDRAGKPLRARACVDSAPLFERASAQRGGLGFIGKSTMLITPGVRTFTLLGELLLDLELPATTDTALGVQHEAEPRATAARAAGCGRCTQCLDFCPTGAFVQPYVLDARRCISYLTIEHDGPIPRELRAAIGVHVFGCDICQQVCPYNHSRKSRPTDPELAPAPTRSEPNLLEWLSLSSSGYRRLVRGSPLRRASREKLQRNAAVALGNSADQAVVEPLVAALSHQDRPLVRGHVAWALGRLGGTKAREALASRLPVEQNAYVIDEIRAALAETGAVPGDEKR